MLGHFIINAFVVICYTYFYKNDCFAVAGISFSLKRALLWQGAWHVDILYLLISGALQIYTQDFPPPMHALALACISTYTLMQPCAHIHTQVHATHMCAPKINGC